MMSKNSSDGPDSPPLPSGDCKTSGRTAHVHESRKHSCHVYLTLASARVCYYSLPACARVLETALSPTNFVSHLCR
ncbi:hypothetical protein [Diadegma fenestrale ichnovirus]|nr:hypothetical protein [Diadegma fenestrale ichnovirus]